jgi:nucleotide-binding universal stress UspA family protein
MVVIDRPGIQRSVGGGGIGSMKYARTTIAAKEEECHEVMESIMAKFKERCDAAGVQHTEFEMQGEPAAAILDESNYFDCVVIGQRTFFTYSSGAGDDKQYGTEDDIEGDALTEILSESLSPVFAVPLNWKAAHDVFDVLIAFDGSLNAMRSVRQFARLYGRASANITVFNCNEDAEASEQMLGKAMKFLEAHGFGKVTTQTYDKSVNDVMSEEFCHPFDLIVLGANSRSTLVEWFTGSVTTELIKRGDKPLLIANG